MTKLRPIFLIIFSIIFFQTAMAHVTLLYPVGGETFQAGEVIEIQWEVAIPHGPANWDLSFSRDGGSVWESIAVDLPESQLSYNWTVPSMATDSGQVRVVQDNQTGMDYSDASGNFTINVNTGIKESNGLTESFILFPAYPNPFNPTTTIRYDLSRSSSITLKVYDIRGKEIKTLVDDFQSAGSKSVRWNGRNDHRQIVSSGVYIYQLQAPHTVKTKKMLFIK